MHVRPVTPAGGGAGDQCRTSPDDGYSEVARIRMSVR